MAIDKIYFEQYKLYIESIEKISDRRNSANKYFITINSSVFALSGLFMQYTQTNQQFLLIGLCVLGLIVNTIFYFLINSYKQLNTGKFIIVHRMEKKLPIKLYTDEWKALGNGKNFKKYFPFSHIEKFVSIVFFACYAFALFFLILCY